MSSTPGTAVTPPGLQLPGSSFFFPPFSDSATPSGHHDSSLSGLAPAPPAPLGFHPRPHCGPMRGAWGGRGEGGAQSPLPTSVILKSFPLLPGGSRGRPSPRVSSAPPASLRMPPPGHPGGLQR